MMSLSLQRLWLAAAVLAGGLGVATPAGAQKPPAPDSAVRAAPRPTRILGAFDDDSGEPLAGVEVIDLLTGTSAVTTATGTVSLNFLATGGSLVRLRKVGYELQTLTISMSPADTAPITVTLKRVTSLPAVITKDSSIHYVAGPLRAFEERRRNHTAGYFIDEQTLRKSEGRPLANVLAANAPGVQITRLSSATFLTKSPRCSNGGQPDVYVDGVPLAHLEDLRWPTKKAPTSTFGVPIAGGGANKADYPIDLTPFQVSSLAGVEYYPDNATMPVQFSRTTAGCGALFLWTRER